MVRIARSDWPVLLIVGLMVFTIGLAWMRQHAHPTIKVMYLLPTDVAQRPDFEVGVHRAVAAAQLWYFNDLGRGVTFGMADPLVETARLAHPESWYRARAQSRNDRENLWEFTLAEAFPLTGGSYNYARHTWAYFLDADLPNIASQGVEGVALLMRKDIVEMLGRQPTCGSVGRIAHELGHAYGLEHPADCDFAPKIRPRSGLRLDELPGRPFISGRDISAARPRDSILQSRLCPYEAGGVAHRVRLHRYAIPANLLTSSRRPHAKKGNNYPDLLDEYKR